MDQETRDFIRSLFEAEAKERRALRRELREGLAAIDRRFDAVEKTAQSIESQVEALARTTATEFKRAGERLDEIVENTASSFGSVERRLSEIEA